MNRHSFLVLAGRGALALFGFTTGWVGAVSATETDPPAVTWKRRRDGRDGDAATTLFLCGDVMTGRGIDQILPHPSKPHLYEAYMRSARGYVDLAERATGPIPRPVDFRYVWGDALGELERVRPDARIVNLETAVTVSEDAWPGKPIHYRMHPSNVGCLTAAQIDCCVLANNHVLDWGRRGLLETLDTLHREGVQTAGAGRGEGEAAAPAVLDLPGKGRVLVFAFGTEDSGVPEDWAAAGRRAGVSFLEDLSAERVAAIARRVRSRKRAGDLAVASIHWGANWSYAISTAQRVFAHRLIDAAGIDLLHGHSSHHVKGIELYHDKLILYGCGDFLNDYEGIGSHEGYRGDLSLMYFPTLDVATGRLVRLAMVPTQVRHFRVNRAPPQGAAWLEAMLNREGRCLNVQLDRLPDQSLLLRLN